MSQFSGKYSTVRCVVTRIHDSSHDMTTIARVSALGGCHQQGKCLTFFLFGKLSKPIMMGDRARGEYVQCYYGPVAAAKVVERPFITHFIWTMCDAGRKQD